MGGLAVSHFLGEGVRLIEVLRQGGQAFGRLRRREQHEGVGWFVERDRQVPEHGIHGGVPTQLPKCM